MIPCLEHETKTRDTRAGTRIFFMSKFIEKNTTAEKQLAYYNTIFKPISYYH